MSFICQGGMEWPKSTLQKDKIYYFKYREFKGIFTINIIFAFLVYCNIVAKNTHTGHTGFTFT